MRAIKLPKILRQMTVKRTPGATRMESCVAICGTITLPTLVSNRAPMHGMPAGATAQGIDVSGDQKNIDWQKVKDACIDFAILKIGNIAAWDPDGWYTDSRFQRNMSECERLGIPYGVYVYSYAMNAREAVNGANQIIALLKGHNPTLPVYLDLEDDSTLTCIDGYRSVQSNHGENMKHVDYGASRASQAAIATAFCNTISAAGYAPGVYSGASWFKNF